MKDLYKLLGVSQYSDLETVKQAYHRMAKEYHPDQYRNSSEREYAENIFKEISNAYEILGNEKNKSKYDQLLKMSTKGIDIPSFMQNSKETYHEVHEPRKTTMPPKRKTVKNLIVAGGISIVLAISGCALAGSKTGTPLENTNTISMDTTTMDNSIENNIDNNTDLTVSYDSYTTLDEVKTIEAGDTLSAYALEYGTSVEELKEINHLTSDKIIAGDTITLERHVKDSDLAKYTMEKEAIAGQTAEMIANANHTDVKTLENLNKDAVNVYGYITTSHIVVPNFASFTNTNTSATNSITK
jgi:LysM repeat protein